MKIITATIAALLLYVNAFADDAPTAPAGPDVLKEDTWVSAVALIEANHIIGFILIGETGKHLDVLAQTCAQDKECVDIVQGLHSDEKIDVLKLPELPNSGGCDKSTAAPGQYDTSI